MNRNNRNYSLKNKIFGFGQNLDINCYLDSVKKNWIRNTGYTYNLGTLILYCSYSTISTDHLILYSRVNMWERQMSSISKALWNLKSVSKSKNIAITNNFVAWKHGGVVTTVLLHAQLCPHLLWRVGWEWSMGHPAACFYS